MFKGNVAPLDIHDWLWKAQYRENIPDFLSICLRKHSLCNSWDTRNFCWVKLLVNPCKESVFSAKAWFCSFNPTFCPCAWSLAALNQIVACRVNPKYRAKANSFQRLCTMDPADKRWYRADLKRNIQTYQFCSLNFLLVSPRSSQIQSFEWREE